jgi:hypothetical protein
MANNRTPLAKAQVSGAAGKNPQRFRDRKGPRNVAPLGEPYAGMPGHELKVWAELAGNLPWLNITHRTLLRLVCRLAGKLATGEITPSEGQLLSSTLSKLGATPVDETKVQHADDDSAGDPSESFFARPN